MHALKLAWRMLWRDVRAGELHLLGLALVIAVAALTSVGFLADRISTGLDREGNQLLGGDLLLSADHPWRAGVADEARSRGLATTDTVLFTSMLGNAHGAELASVKAVQDGYPLRGVLRTAPGLNEADAVASGVPAPGEVWLDERLMTSLQAKVGDVVEFGQLDLRVAALLTFESDRGGNFISLAPRALVNVADLAASELLGAGSRPVTASTWRARPAPSRRSRTGRVRGSNAANASRTSKKRSPPCATRSTRRSATCGWRRWSRWCWRRWRWACARGASCSAISTPAR